MRREVQSLSQQGSRLVQVEDDLLESLAEDEVAHARIQRTDVMSEMNSGVEEIFDCEKFVNAEEISSFGRILRVLCFNRRRRLC